MALIFRNPDGSYSTRCALCGEQLTQPIFATSHFIGDAHHDLHRYSDAAMHWDCFAGWEHQERFAAMRFTALTNGSESRPSRDYWPTLLRDDEHLLVRFGVAVNEISIALRASGTDLRVLRTDWESFVAGRWVEWSHHPLEHAALAAAMPRIRDLRLPDPL